MPRCNPAPRKEARNLSSSGIWPASDLWYESTMCMIELAMNTNTADSRMGSQRALRKIIGSLFLSNLEGIISCEAILFPGEGQGCGNRNCAPFKRLASVDGQFAGTSPGANVITAPRNDAKSRNS